jgi:hypothetical protein
MTFQKTLAQHHIGDRVTVQVAIGNKTYVVKIADPMMVDHLMNSDLINRLNLNDVHAPASKQLTNEFKLALQKQIPQKFDPEETLVGALKGNAMISPMAPGSRIYDLLDKRSNDVSGKKKLLDYVATKDGAHALGAIMMIDLVDGMYDRLFNFNGNNFLFDPATKKLWCIDNAKRPDYGLSATDDSSWKQWVIGRNNALDDNNDTSTDKGKSVPELFHWMIYERKEQSNPGFGPQLTLSDEAKNNTAAWIKKAFTDTRSALLELVNDTGLPQEVRDRLTQRLAFLDRRNDFIDLLRDSLSGFTEFETIPTPTNRWFPVKFFRKAQREILNTTQEQEKGERWKTQARNKSENDNELKELDTQITDYLQENPKADDRVRKALFAVRSARFVRALKAQTDSLAPLQKLPPEKRAWGKLDPAITSGIQKSAAAWVKELRAAGDQEGANEVETAAQAFLKLLNG